MLRGSLFRWPWGPFSSCRYQSLSHLRNDNPCDRVLAVLGPQNDIVTHRRAPPHQEVPAAIETVRTSASAQPAVKLAFEFLVLTAAVSGSQVVFQSCD